MSSTYRDEYNRKHPDTPINMIPTTAKVLGVESVETEFQRLVTDFPIDLGGHAYSIDLFVLENQIPTYEIILAMNFFRNVPERVYGSFNTGQLFINGKPIKLVEPSADPRQSD